MDRSVANSKQGVKVSAAERDTPPSRFATVDAEEHPAADPVDEAGVESFPASDPPSWWAGPPD